MLIKILTSVDLIVIIHVVLWSCIMMIMNDTVLRWYETWMWLGVWRKDRQQRGVVQVRLLVEHVPSLRIDSKRRFLVCCFEKDLLLRSVLLKSSDAILWLKLTILLGALRETKTGEKALFLLLRIAVICFDGQAIFDALQSFVLGDFDPLQLIYVGKASRGLMAFIGHVLLSSTLIAGFANCLPLITHLIAQKLLLNCGWLDLMARGLYLRKNALAWVLSTDACRGLISQRLVLRLALWPRASRSG